MELTGYFLWLATTTIYGYATYRVGFRVGVVTSVTNVINNAVGAGLVSDPETFVKRVTEYVRREQQKERDDVE